MIIGEITEYVGVDRIVAKRLRVPLQTDPAEPTVDVQVQSFRPLSVAVSPAKSAKCPQRQTSRARIVLIAVLVAQVICASTTSTTYDALKYSKAQKARRKFKLRPTGP